jgi:hypothetical protein
VTGGLAGVIAVGFIAKPSTIAGVMAKTSTVFVTGDIAVVVTRRIAVTSTVTLTGGTVESITGLVTVAVTALSIICITGASPVVSSRAVVSFRVVAGAEVEIIAAGAVVWVRVTVALSITCSVIEVSRVISSRVARADVWLESVDNLHDLVILRFTLYSPRERAPLKEGVLSEPGGSEVCLVVIPHARAGLDSQHLYSFVYVSLHIPVLGAACRRAYFCRRGCSGSSTPGS